MEDDSAERPENYPCYSSARDKYYSPAFIMQTIQNEWL